MLDHLPQDVLHIIIEQLPNVTDIKHLSEVSKGLHDATLPLLYASLTLRVSESHTDKLDIKSLQLALDKGHLKHTRHLEITSPFHSQLDKRCIHNCNWRLSHNVFIESDNRVKVDKVEKSLIALVGICIPESMMGPSGYFPVRQPNIETLHLVTDGSCPLIYKTGVKLAVSSFPKLKRLSWAGFCIKDEIRVLHETLKKTAHQLTELNLDILHHRNYNEMKWEDDKQADSYEIVFAVFVRDILRIPYKVAMKFPALRVLSLSGASFWQTGTDMPYLTAVKKISEVFDFSTLGSLKLRLCPGWEDLLGLLVEYPQPVRYKSLELHCTETLNRAHDTITLFLISFEGLEDFFLRTGPEQDKTLSVWRSLAYHKKTVKRFVYHHYQRNELERSPQHGLGTGQLVLMPSRDEMSRLYERSELINLLHELEISCFGINAAPQNLKSVVETFVTKDTLKVLHLRHWWPLEPFELPVDPPPSFLSTLATSPSETEFDYARLYPENKRLNETAKKVLEFAQWVFGPKGIKSLRLFAIGDFSYDGRFDKYNHLLCRREQADGTPGGNLEALHFRHLGPEDEELWELYHENLDMLGACPSCDLLEYEDPVWEGSDSEDD
ncbi:hypothetical protein F5884DRAFT_750497 [Xylogone sp. PMI_703]|nr:hypothetical protein F5884DRAFT_750497 [Xylogone sp. PMI_703]